MSTQLFTLSSINHHRFYKRNPKLITSGLAVSPELFFATFCLPDSCLLSHRLVNNKQLTSASFTILLLQVASVSFKKHSAFPAQIYGQNANEIIRLFCPKLWKLDPTMSTQCSLCSHLSVQSSFLSIYYSFFFYYLFTKSYAGNKLWD